MRVLCEHMDKDRLKTPFWIGKYRIQPISQTIVDEGQGPCTNYKVLISQPQLGLLKEKIQTHVESQPPALPVESAVPAPQKPSDLQKPAPAPLPEQRPAPRPAPMSEQKPAPRPEPRPEQTAEPGQIPEPRPEQRAEPPPKHRSIEPLPKLKPDQGLPFLAGVPTAGLLIAQQKDGESCPIMVCSCLALHLCATCTRLLFSHHCSLCACMCTKQCTLCGVMYNIFVVTDFSRIV